MTRDQIIHNLFTGTNFSSCISKMEPDHLREDLKQEVILIVCELPHEKLVGLHERGQLDFFVARIIITQISGNRTPFNKKFRQVVQELDGYEQADTADNEHREIKELIEDMAMAEIAAMKDHKEHWYAYELIQLYIKHNNFRAIEKETRIPFISCYKTIKKTILEIRTKVDYIKSNPLCNRTK